MLNLREYQIELKNNAYNALKIYRRVMVQLPTGGGKTIIFASIAADAAKHGKKVLILVHRIELVEQARAKIKEQSGIETGLIHRDVFDISQAVTVASVQTFSRRDFPKFDLIIIDEAHHAVSKSYTDIISHYTWNGAKILGFTATPQRLDGSGFKKMFDFLVCGKQMKELVELGYLVRTRNYVSSLHEELKNIKTSAGDYNKKSLINFAQKNFLVGEIVGEWLAKAQGRKTILFATSVELAEFYADCFNEEGIPAKAVSAKTDKEERRQIIKDFRDGKYTVLTNCEIFTEGFDTPDVGCVQILKPTKSLSLHLQMIGRGLRTADGKADCIILDHAGNTILHGTAERLRA